MQSCLDHDSVRPDGCSLVGLVSLSGEIPHKYLEWTTTASFQTIYEST